MENGFLSLRDVCPDSRIEGLVGLLVGDALGVGFEFLEPEQIPPLSQIEMVMPDEFERTYPEVPPGTWSDDGSQALCLAASVLECGQFSLTNFSQKLVRWYNTGYMSVDNDLFDCGEQTERSLERLMKGISPLESGGCGGQENGNGSLMRVLPLALLHTGSDEALARDAHLQSLPTHAHPISMVACAFYCLVARAYRRGTDHPWEYADTRLEEIYKSWLFQTEQGSFLAALGSLRDFPRTNRPAGTGYVIDTLWSVRKAMEQKSFADVTRAAISFGHDTDTTAAIACGLAAIRFGLRHIPEKWLGQLRGYEIFAPIAQSIMSL